MYVARVDALEVGQNEDAHAVAARLDNDLGVNEWWSPMQPRRPERTGPRVTEDGLKVPSWWADEETESQQWLLSQGVVL